jgi:quercetin dioxygenase-like cupin family protein
MSRPMSQFRWDEIALDKVTDMVACKSIATGQRTLTQAYFKKGTLVPRHAHSGDLFIYVLQGTLRVDVQMTRSTLREGDVLVVPAGAVHQAESLDDTFVLTFS